MQSLESGIRYTGGGRPIPVSPILDLSSVKTRSPRNMQSDGSKRPFGLEDCPAFYPTVDEFKDPMAYVRSISTTAKNHGICKVVPPAGWKMPFVTDTEVRRNSRLML
jgi:histone demethylase JARID1